MENSDITVNDRAVMDHLDSIEDPDEAIATAIRLLTDNKTRASKNVTSMIRQGRKRHPGFGLHKYYPLEGVTYHVSGQIRKIVGLRYSGFSDAEIERVLGVSEKYINKLECRTVKAFQQAQEELIKAAVKEYNQNVAFSRAALSESAFAAVDTLTRVMNDKKSKPGERLKAAELVLKLTIGAPGASPGEMAGEIISSFGEALSKISKSAREGDYIKNVNDGEVIDVETIDVDA